MTHKEWYETIGKNIPSDNSRPDDPNGHVDHCYVATQIAWEEAQKQIDIPEEPKE